MSNFPLKIPIACVATKIKYPCAFPAGLLETARVVLTANNINASIVYVCGGKANEYNNKNNWGYGPNDIRIDIDESVNPEILMDVRHLDKNIIEKPGVKKIVIKDMRGKNFTTKLFDAALIDRDYNEFHAARHKTGESTWPSNLTKLTKDTFKLVKPGGLVGVFDFKKPSMGDKYRQLYSIQVLLPGNQAIRQLTVWQERKLPKSIKAFSVGL